MTGITKPPSVLKALMNEAKKDSYPVGTLRLYNGKMANGDYAAHIYVKTGKKGKPWSYYATYPSAKADEMIKAGGGLVVNVDGKLKVFPATSEHLKTWGKEHPFKGELIPSIVVGGDYNLGAVTDDGDVAIDPGGIKELDVAVEKAKEAFNAANAKSDTSPPPVAPPPPEAPKDEPGVVSVSNMTPAQKQAYDDEEAASKEKNKKLKAFGKLAVAAAEKGDVDAVALLIKKSQAAGASPLTLDALAVLLQQAQDVTSAAKSELDKLSWSANELEAQASSAADFLAAAKLHAEAHQAALKAGDNEKATYHKNKAEQLAAHVIDVEKKNKTVPYDATYEHPAIQAALKKYSKGETLPADIVAEYPGFKTYLQKFVNDPSHWADSLWVLNGLYKNPDGLSKFLDNEELSPIAKMFASEMGLKEPDKPALAAVYSFPNLAKQLADKLGNAEEFNTALSIMVNHHPDMFSGYGIPPFLIGRIAAHTVKYGATKTAELFAGDVPDDVLDSIAAAVGVEPQKKKKFDLGSMGFDHHDVATALSDYNAGWLDSDTLEKESPHVKAFLSQFNPGGSWKDVLYVAAGYKKNVDDANHNYAGDGPGANYHNVAVGVATAMGLPLPPSKKKKKDAEGALPPVVVNPDPTPAPPPTAPATPDNSPTPEDASLKGMISYLKQIGFGDPEKHAEFVKSPAWMGQMGSQYGKNWISKLMIGAPALGIDPATLEPKGAAPAPQDTTPQMVLPPSGLSLKATLKNIGLEYMAVGESFGKLKKKSKEFVQAYAKYTGVDDTETASIMGLIALDPQKVVNMGMDGKYGAAVTKIAKDMETSLPAPQVAAPATKLAPEAPSTGSSAKETPVPTDPMPQAQFASLATPQCPPLSEMKKGASAKSLGGAGKKDFYSDKKGNKYLVKLALEKDGSAKPKPFAAIVQEVFSSVALTVRPDHIPLRVDTNADGVMVTVQPFLDRGDPPTVEGMKPSQLTPQEKADVANEHVLDWMMSQHDSYGGNLVRRKDGRVVGVDKEQAFRFFPDDKLDVDYNPNPIAPYYNEFWQAFRDNQMDFDPKVMKDTIAKIEQISDVDYAAQVERYAKSIWPSEVNKRAKFIKDALERKKNIRHDFEGFISDLYQKRTGVKKGVFTFNTGWDPTGKAPTVAKKKNLVKVKAKEWAVNLGLKEYPYAPTEGPDKGVSDPNKIVIKVPKGNKESLLTFAKDTGLNPIGAVIDGNYYHLAIFDKKAYDAVEIEKELAKPIEVEPEDSSALVEIDPHKPAEMNNQELAKLETEQLGPLGKRYASDSAGIEGQYMRVKRIVDTSGEVHYLFQFKMRPAMVGTLMGGSSGNHSFPKYAYQPGPDALSDTGEKATSMTLKGLKWKNGSSEAFIYKDDHEYTFKNSVFIKVKPKKGQSVQEAFGETLEKMRPGLAADLMKNPTPEEREVAKLARLLWAASPQEADALKPGDYTLDALKKKLGKHGFDDNDFAKIEERETYSGLQSHIIPGRHKKLGGGKFRFMFNGISDTAAAVSVLKLGLLGISERAMMGIFLKGGSVEADIHEGAGDQVLLRPVTENGFTHNMGSHPFGGSYQAVVDPAEADRLDSYMHNSDQFGSCSPYGSHASAWTNRKTLEKAMDNQAKSYSSGAEIMFRKGIAKSKILRIAAPTEAARAELIKEAKKAGVVEMNGVSIDNFVVVAKTSGEAYEKCVKPVLAKAAAKAASK